ncbi:hypothetical protein [Paenibacillus sp. 481]|nr:hypothetical protein [Paenibacillus sp. 481]UHA72483.1 hypothetical protein KIK04_17680 [Paenibacillus sp. 481]
MATVRVETGTADQQISRSADQQFSGSADRQPISVISLPTACSNRQIE